MWNRHKERDERSVAVEHRAGYVAYQVVSYLLLLDIILHVMRPGLTDWNGWSLDLWAMIFLGGAVQWTIILRERIVGRRRAVMLAGVLVAGMVVSAAIAMVLTRR